MNVFEVAYKVMISLPSCSARRWKLHETLCSNYGIYDVECMHPVPISDIEPGEYPHLPSTAYPYVSQTLTLRNMIREARRRKAESVWLLEDDAVFHREFLDRSRQLKVPNNWRFVYLGGAFYEGATRVNSGLVKPERILDLHSVIISEKVFDAIEERLTWLLEDWNNTDIFPDVAIADLHRYHPAYLCSPNLVWQSAHQSDLKGRHYSNYKASGEQWYCPYTPEPIAAFTAPGFVLEEVGNVEALATALEMARKSFLRIVLYTDERGRDLIDHLYFDEVLSNLDSVTPEFSEIACVLHTVSKMTEPFVHFDFRNTPNVDLSRMGKGVYVAEAASRQESSRLVSLAEGLRWMPPFVKKILQNKAAIRSCSFGIIAGSNPEFFLWFAATAAELLRKAFKGATLKEAEKDPEFRLLICNWLLGACAFSQGMSLGEIGITESNDQTTEPFSKKAKIEHLDRPQGLRQKSSSRRPPGADRALLDLNRGYGWYLDFHDIPLKYQLTGNAPAMRSISFPDLGIVLPWEHEGASFDAAVSDICKFAKETGADSVLILDEDVVLSSNLSTVGTLLKIPFDWHVLFLSGDASKKTIPVGRGLLRCDAVRNGHAVIIRQSAFDTIIGNAKSGSHPTNSKLANTCAKLPTYVCAPPLAAAFENFTPA